MDKLWRPANWAAIKRMVVEDTPATFSPSTGYSKDRYDQIMEKLATALLEELVNAGIICGQERGSGEAGESVAWFGAKPGESAGIKNQKPESS
uniref:Uncharacterized protein n=1 Tax=viral metagenome TaxID=1070528 RepID=A0A6M3JDW9_9ZZZZ